MIPATICLVGAGGPVGAQDSGGGGTSAAQGQSFEQVYASIKSADPTRRAGFKSAFLAQAMQVIPIVVIVDEPRAYLEAISGWEGLTRYPVLYDDGTDLSRENIGRFIRAFEPEEVIRITEPGSIPWGTTTEDRQESLSTAFARALNETEPDWRVTLTAMRQSGVISPGVVVIDPLDHHWAGGLALAAGRFEHVIFVNGMMNHFRELTPSQSDSINEVIRQWIAAAGFSYSRIGDDIDMITLAFRAGIKVKTGPLDRDRVATTDRIGRTGESRWAWCGQLYGSTSTGVYQAMSSLFLPMDSAFVWDGYPSTGDWARYDGTEAGEALIEEGVETELFDEPRNSLASFKARGDSRPVDASLILMNTKGAHHYFDLPQAPEGIGKFGNLPLLSKPSALHIVHSFSLSMPHNIKTVGGRWLERGVYLYAGSVDEPFLSGFVPTPIVAKRILGQLPFAAAIHYDDGSAWKIAVIGDPLKAYGQCGTRVEMTPDEVEQWIKDSGGVALTGRAGEQLKEGAFSRAIEDFMLTNRDDAVVRLAKVLLRDKPEAVDDRAAKIIVQSAMRQGEHELVLDAFERLSAQERTEVSTLDALWFAGRYRLSRFGDPRAMALLRTNLRERQEIFDAEDVAMHIRKDSLSDAIAFMETLRPSTPASERRLLDQAINRVRR